MKGRIDEVIVKVTGKVDKSSSANIESLAESLGKLKASIAGGYNNLNKLATSLETLKKSSKSVETINTNFASLNNITKSLEKLTTIGSPKGLNNIVKTLNELPKTFAQLDTNTLTQIDEVAKNLNQHLVPLGGTLAMFRDSIKGGFSGVGKLAEYLVKLKEASKGLDKTAEQLSVTSTLVEKLEPLSTITSPKGLTKTIKDLEQLPKVISKITPDTLQNVARVSEQLATSLTPLANKFAEIAVGFSSLQALANKYGVSVTKITEGTNKTINKMTMLKRVVNSVKAPFQKLQSVINTFAKKTDKGFDKLISKNKQLVLSLLGTRSIFTATRKAISEYMQMDAELTKETTNLWRALGAQLAPAVEEVLYLFKQALRVVYSFVYAITGVDLIARANAKAMKSWGSAASSTLGSLQKFDDLNVADFGKGSDDNQLIELDKIDLSPIQKVIDWVKKLKETIKSAWKTGKWTAVAEVIGEGFEYAINNFPSDKLADVISKTITTSFKVINTLINKIPWKKLGSKIRETILNIKWGEIIEEVGNTISSVLSSGLSFISGLTGVTIDTSSFGFINDLTSISQNLDWSNLLTSLTNLGDSLKPFAENVGTGLVWFYNELLVPLTTYVVNELVPTFIDMLSEAFDALNTIIDIIKPNIDWLWENVLNPLLEITEMVIISLIEDLTKKFEGFSTWCSNNERIVSIVTDMIISFLGALFLHLSIQGVAGLVKVLASALTTFAAALAAVNIPLVITVAGFAGLIYGITEIYKNWDKMNNLEKVASVLGVLAIAATTAAIAVGAFQSAWSLGIAAAAIVAGIVAITAAVNSATKRAESLKTSISNTTAFGSSGGGGSRGYATGGFPEKGQYFYARENGIPEYVGSIGSQTAVANNNQIIEGIKKGVKDAISESDFETTTIVNVGNKTLYNEQKRYNNFQRNKYGTINV